MEIYIGNVSRESSEDEVKELFLKYGAVENFKLIKDLVTGQLKGFGFIEMPDDDEGQKDIDELNDMEFKDRKLTVTVANPSTAKKKKPKPKPQQNKNQGNTCRKTHFKGGYHK